MTQIQVQEVHSANEALEMPPAQVQEWLASVWSGEQKVPEDFNWHGLAEVAADRANRRLLGEQPNLEWAEVSVAIYERLAIEDEGDSFLQSAMTLRAALILQLGAKRGHPVLDPEPIFHWFYDNLHLARDEAIKQASTWREFGPGGGVGRNELLMLRRIKNRLGVIKLMSEGTHFTPDAELAKWLEVREQLP